MIEIDYKPVLENNTYKYINVVSSAGIIIERFTCKDKMSSYLVKNAFLPIEWRAYFREHTNETFITVFVL
mgnify:FL=1|tara:strand:+ start:176 stop:385 length:210 start_codon:yes stop_codon:yes gene_type:complete